MGMFQRKSWWQQVTERVGTEAAGVAKGAVRNPALKAGATAAAGAAVVTMASAAVSALRRKGGGS
jgi:hypothetical protein